MHSSAFDIGKLFFDTYIAGDHPVKVIDVGSQNINGTLKSHITKNVTSYVGADFEAGNGVDVVLEDSYKFPFENNTFDALVTSSCFEHSEMFWLTFLEGMRVLKPDGLMYINAPSSWHYHRHPYDCWRFFPDAGKGLETWARYSKIQARVLETFIFNQTDWVCVFIKDENYMDLFPNRMLDSLVYRKQFTKGFRFPASGPFDGTWQNPV